MNSAALLRAEGEGAHVLHTQLSTMYTASGEGPEYRRLPMVLHNAEHTLYEEPCVVAMDLLIGEVRRSHSCEIQDNNYVFGCGLLPLNPRIP